MKFSVSVVVAVYNEEEYVGRCLETLLEQNPPSPPAGGFGEASLFEVIVVDDGSSDRTILKIKEQISLLRQGYGGQAKMQIKNRKEEIEDENTNKLKSQEAKKLDTNLRLYGLAHEGKGPARARNFGAKKAKGEILVFVDGDMEFRDNNFVAELVEPIVRGEVKGTFSKEEYVANWDNPWARCWNYDEDLADSRRIPEDYPDEGVDFRAILKSEFLAVGGFEDIGYTDTWSLVEKLGYRPKVVKGAKYWHYNPGRLREVFSQARWIGGRRFKMGFLGKLVALVRASVVVSLGVGVWKSIKFREWRFLLFRIVYDLGITVGILRSFDII